jgi:hypothetical protein
MPLIEQGDANNYAAKADTAGDQRYRLRYAAMSVALFALLAIAAVRRVDSILESHADEYANFRKASIDDSVSFAALPHNETGCDNNTICFCSYGKDGSMVKGCKQWTFKVGDVLIFQYGPANDLELKVINLVMNTLFDGAVHAALISEVHGPDLKDIIVTECLKGNKMRMISSTLYEVLGFRMYHGFWIRRVDKERFPQFAQKAQAITAWSKARVGEPFSKAGIAEKAIIFPWRYASPSWIAANPGCAQREKAMKLYRKGGPGSWFCSQFVAWTLAFPGGLNTDYATSKSCSVPRWTGMIENLQPAPGDLINQPVWDNSSFFMPCPMGCDTSFRRPTTTTSFLRVHESTTSRESTTSQPMTIQYNSTPDVSVIHA